MNSVVELQPTLTGKSISLRPLVPADWDALYAAASDPEIWAQHPARDRYTQPVFRAFFDEALASGSALVFVDESNGRIFGSSRFHGFDPERREIEIGWTFMSRDYWGGEANGEVKALMLQHAFRFVDTVLFWVGEENLRSRRAMEKIGGVCREGTFTRAAGGDVPHVIYEIRNPERC